MTIRETRSRIAAAAAIAVALLAGACSTSEEAAPVPQDEVPSPTSPAVSRCRTPAGVDSSDADAVADAAVSVMACHDTRSDASPLEAIRRARTWLDPALVPDAGAQTRTDNVWAEWAKANAWTPVTVERIDLQQPPDYTSGVVSLARETTSAPTGSDGHRVGPDAKAQWILTLEKRGSAWTVTSIEQN